jgi:hypothetical protein
MRIEKTLVGLSVALILASTGVGRVAAQDRERARERDETPCTLKEEPINDDGSLRKPQRLVDLERQHDAAPRDEAITRELVKELFTLAQYMMYCSKAAPKQKYPLAHCLYARVLALDSENKEAREGKELIESIYDSMEKPRPSGECP